MQELTFGLPTLRVVEYEGHARHAALVVFTSVQNVPTGQGVQIVLPPELVLDTDPGGQRRQLPTPTDWNPARHVHAEICVFAVELVVDHDGHLVHRASSERVVLPEYVLRGHPRHGAAATSILYFPAAHGVQLKPRLSSEVVWPNPARQTQAETASFATLSVTELLGQAAQLNREELPEL